MMNQIQIALSTEDEDVLAMNYENRDKELVNPNEYFLGTGSGSLKNGNKSIAKLKGNT